MRKLRLLIPVVILVLLFLLIRLFVIKDISCKQFDESPCPQKLNEKFEMIEGKTLLFGWRNTQQILKTTPFVDQFILSLRAPFSLSATVKIRKADIAMKPENSDLYSLYTKEGVFVDEVKQTQVPSILLKEQIKNEQVPFVATLAYELSQTLSIGTISIVGTSMKIDTSDGRILYYPLDGDIDVLLGATLITFSQLNQNDGKLIIKDGPTVIREIDFRFKNPVLR